MKTIINQLLAIGLLLTALSCHLMAQVTIDTKTSTSVTFTVTTKPVNSNTSVNISGAYGSTTRMSRLTVTH